MPEEDTGLRVTLYFVNNRMKKDLMLKLLIFGMLSSITVTFASGRNIALSIPVWSVYIDDTTLFIDKLPSVFECKLLGNRLYVFDQINSRIDLFDITKRFSVQKMGIKESIVRDGYFNFFKDSLSYSRLDSMIKRMKMPPFIKLNQLISFDVKGDTVFALMESLYPKKCQYKQKADTCFFHMYNLIKYVGGKYVSSVCVRNSVEDSTLSYYYQDYQIEGSRLHVLDTGLLVNISRSKLGTKNQYIGLWQDKHDEFVFESGVGPDLPRLNYQYEVRYDLNDYIIKDSFMMHRFSNIIHKGNEDEIKLKFRDLKGLIDPSDDPYEPKSVNFMIHDFIVEDKTIHLLYTLKGEVIYQKFDISGNEFSEPQILFYFEKGSEAFRAAPVFYGQGLVVLFPSGSNQMIRLRVK